MESDIRLSYLEWSYLGGVRESLGVSNGIRDSIRLFRNGPALPVTIERGLAQLLKRFDIGKTSSTAGVSNKIIRSATVVQ